MRKPEVGGIGKRAVIKKESSSTQIKMLCLLVKNVIPRVSLPRVSCGLQYVT